MLQKEDFQLKKISNECDLSQTTVRYWLKKYNLKTIIKIKRSDDKRKKDSVIAVARRRKKLKDLSIEYKGGCCQFCGYNKCKNALEFHHIDRKQKEFGISQSGCTRSFAKIKIELDKCVMLCANCHREEHARLEENNIQKLRWFSSIGRAPHL